MLPALLLCVAALGAADEFLAWVSEPAGVSSLPDNRDRRLSPTELAAVVNAKPVLPFHDVTVGLRAPDGALWLGSRRGLMYLAPQAARSARVSFAPLAAG